MTHSHNLLGEPDATLLPANPEADGELARMYLATGLLPLGKSQLSEFGSAPAPSTRGSGRCARPGTST